MKFYNRTKEIAPQARAGSRMNHKDDGATSSGGGID